MYEVNFLPIAMQDAVEIVQYIKYELKNKSAADKFSNNILKSANVLQDFPYKNPAYFPARKLKHEYRKQIIGNYIMFYWVDEEENKVTVARIIYAQRDYENLL